MTVLNIHTEIFNKKYRPFVQSNTKRYEVYYGSAGSGKSVFVAQKLVIRALQSQRKILVLRKVGRTVKQSVFQLLIDTLSFFQILDRCKINKTDFSIELPNGSIFLCSGLDDAEKIKSIVNITDIWMEEANEFILDDFNQLDLRLRHPSAKGQQILLSFNPVSKASWVYKLFFAEDVEQEVKTFRENVEIIHSTYKDNRFLPQAYIDSLLMLKATNPAYYTIYAEGKFGSLDKLIFQNWEVRDFNHKELEGHLLVGLDFGYINDPSALIASILNEEQGTLHIFTEHFAQGQLNNEIANTIKQLGFAKSIIIADSAEQKSIDEIKRLGISRIKPAVKGQGSILQGIQKLQQYKIYIHPSCTELIVEFQNYAWKKDKQTNEYINTPIDAFNHGCDALRYSLQCHEPNKKLSSIDIKLLGL